MDHPKGAIYHANLAFIERVSYFTIGIIRAKPEEVSPGVLSESVGTCAALKWNGKPLLITAAHNVRDCTPQDLRFSPKPTAASYLATSNIVDARFGMKVTQTIPVKAIHVCGHEEDDLAVIELCSGNSVE